MNYQRLPSRTVRYSQASCVISVVLFVLVPTAARAWAGPPYFTDDPEPVEYRHWEVYIASMYSHDSGGTAGTAPHFEVNYGVVPNVQLHLITPLAFSRQPGGSLQYGYGDTEFGVKYRFVQETSTRPQIGTFPLVEIPTGDSASGLGNGQAQYFIPIWLQKSHGRWSSYGGGGYWRNPGMGNRDWWFTGLQTQCQVTKRLALGAEVFHETPNLEGGASHTGFNIGVVSDFDEGHHLLFSIGRDFSGSTSLNSYVAYQWTF